MNNRKNDDFFRYLISGMDSKMQAQLNHMYSKSRMYDDFIHRQELEKMKREIIAEIMPQITIMLEANAIKQLKDMIDDLGR